MITYWHNPRCSKSRAGLALLQEAGVVVETRLYLVDAPSLAELTEMAQALGLPAGAMLRRGDALCRDLGLHDDQDDATLLAAMAAHPALIERPIARRGDRAVIGRPTEALNALL